MYTLPHGIELMDSRAGSEGGGAGRATRGGAEDTAGVVRRTTGARLIGAGSGRRAVSPWGSGGGGATARWAGGGAAGARRALATGPPAPRPGADAGSSAARR